MPGSGAGGTTPLPAVLVPPVAGFDTIGAGTADAGDPRWTDTSPRMTVMVPWPLPTELASKVLVMRTDGALTPSASVWPGAISTVTPVACKSAARTGVIGNATAGPPRFSPCAVTSMATPPTRTPLISIVEVGVTVP